MYLIYVLFEGDNIDSRVYGNIFKTRQEALNFLEEKYYFTYCWYGKENIKNFFPKILKELEENEDYKTHDYPDGYEINYEIHLSNITDLTTKN